MCLTVYNGFHGSGNLVLVIPVRSTSKSLDFNVSFKVFDKHFHVLKCQAIRIAFRDMSWKVQILDGPGSAPVTIITSLRWTHEFPSCWFSRLRVILLLLFFYRRALFLIVNLVLLIRYVFLYKMWLNHQPQAIGRESVFSTTWLNANVRIYLG